MEGLLAVVMALGVSATPPPPKPTTAVLELDAPGTSSELARTLGLLVPTEVRRWARGEVKSADEIATLLGLERQRQLLGCSDDATECMAEIAGALGAAEVVVSRLGRVGSSFVLEFKRMDAHRGRVLASTTRSVASEQGLVAAAKELIAELYGVVRRRSLVGTAALFGGAGLVALGGASGITGLVIHRQVVAQQSAQLTPTVTRSTARTAELLYHVGLPVAVVGAAAALFGFFESTEQQTAIPAVVFTPAGGAALAITGTF